MNKSLPKVIFFDAVGTLFGIKGGVGEIYAAIALNHGVSVAAEEIDRAFRQSFAAAEPLAFKHKSPKTITEQEFYWWKKVVIATFVEAKALNNFTDFDLFFEELYVYFSTEKPWFIYPEVINVLNNWQQKQVPLGIISNFDTRIYNLLKLLELEHYFDSITISSEVGAAKPEPKIFNTALASYSCQPEQAWYIGDSFTEDYQGAKQIGMQAFWLRRGQNLNLSKNQLPTLNSLG
ncbi:haloacid dehalogenase superfamily protein, subfamily IA, variant 3 with third motif having DD or ED,haloacid dehalogenase superfamily enzyme, subfamily IA,REG-2-like HAD hydrolase, subfamily IA [Xenococcus sp. PCC 7305]|uniref:HAD-IA family hydrolase n=1 Tax=Xenococcus sp. PCC 7305 TaxID=102125 RepID=UPI0002AC4EBB|nr:HAD-IA family hydrolase [Xenococcus sp. PCC 7305]ELS02019.1 haloacid dehalogenase superfamily protein, subfamily IA, variant 3 with third motif having DD or ED,haloacid dehalogenase superfamily enzyme, subfamily IA,REG-2-like HAD hydrolase, subfamily IA [Xenococcus sp. PCC 7305]